MTASATEKSGSWIPWVFVGAFMVVFAANIALVVFANRSWTGLETQDAYTKGLRYNDTLAEARAQQQLGWKSVVGVSVIDAEKVSLKVQLTDDRDLPLNGARVNAVFVRPTHEGIDVAVELVASAQGAYVAEAVLPLDGVWDVAVTAKRDGRYFETSERVVVER